MAFSTWINLLILKTAMEKGDCIMFASAGMSVHTQCPSCMQCAVMCTAQLKKEKKSLQF